MRTVPSADATYFYNVVLFYLLGSILLLVKHVLLHLTLLLEFYKLLFPEHFQPSVTLRFSWTADI